MKKAIAHYMAQVPPVSRQIWPIGVPLPAWLVKGSHQRRMTSKCVKKTLKALEDAHILKGSYKDFEELYAAIRKSIIPIRGIGDLAVYDIAMRMGRMLQIEVLPSAYVYVARGALQGAKALLGADVVKKSLDSGVRLPISLFDRLFQGITSEYIEAILCIYKDSFVLGGIKKGVSFSSDNVCGGEITKKAKSCIRIGKEYTIC